MTAFYKEHGYLIGLEARIEKVEGENKKMKEGMPNLQ